MVIIAKNPAYPIQREAALQRWDLYTARTSILCCRRSALTTARQRQLAQWVLQLPEYSRDKRGHNVAILVLQLLHFLRERNLEAVLLRLERLRKYQQRHLYEASTLRSRLFLRLLQLIVEKNFDADGWPSGARRCCSSCATRRRPARPLPKSKSFPTNTCGSWCWTCCAKAHRYPMARARLPKLNYC